MHCVQVAAFREQLHSRDSFVLLTPLTAYLWHGDHSRKVTRDAAQVLFDKLSGDERDPLPAIDEGDETDEFWDELGDDKEFPDAKYWEKYKLFEMRMFRCRAAQGEVQIEEVCILLVSARVCLCVGD